MKTKFFTAMTTFFILALIGEASAVSFRNRDFKGDYGYLASGTFTQSIEPEIPSEATYSEIGVLRPNGRGNIERGPFRSIVAGSIQFSGYVVGNYSVDPDGVILMNLQYFDDDDNLLDEGPTQGVLNNRNTQVQFYVIPGLLDTTDVKGVAIKQ